MNKIFNSNNKFFSKQVYYYINIFTFVFFILIFFISFTGVKKKKGYELFVEFNDAHLIKEGTSINLRGVRIGSVSRVNIHINKIVVLIFIKSSKILIPKNSLLETHQIGLFNDVVINITPLEHIQSEKTLFNKTAFDKSLSSVFILPNSYIKGYKGINYDDLIRATTRISQRFDDPRFFSLIYLLLRNMIYISDEFSSILSSSSYLSKLLPDFVSIVFYRYIY
uniref:Mce/MlaD domain-containing protein n=1 Tax=Polysiphonia scopulorum TaxID=257860 RepID=A0A1Z1MIH9_9FLOR|nr:hypothetical protein [Polysiphonia scopulorum]ARW65544.1 hypothetical protein [Polysiphonia scopulorum]